MPERWLDGFCISPEKNDLLTVCPLFCNPSRVWRISSACRPGPGPELLHPRLLLDSSHSPQSHCSGFGRNPYADGSGPNFKPSLLFTVGPHNQVAPSKLARVIVMISGDQCQAISCERMAFRTMSETFLRALSFAASSMKWV